MPRHTGMKANGIAREPSNGTKTPRIEYDAPVKKIAFSTDLESKPLRLTIRYRKLKPITRIVPITTVLEISCAIRSIGLEPLARLACAMVEYSEDNFNNDATL